MKQSGNKVIEDIEQRLKIFQIKTKKSPGLLKAHVYTDCAEVDGILIISFAAHH